MLAEPPEALALAELEASAELAARHTAAAAAHMVDLAARIAAAPPHRSSIRPLMQLDQRIGLYQIQVSDILSPGRKSAARRSRSSCRTI